MRVPLSEMSFREYSSRVVSEETIRAMRTYIHPRTGEARKRKIEHDLGIQRRGLFIVIEKAGIVIDYSKNFFKLSEINDAHLMFVDEHETPSLISCEFPQVVQEEPKPFKLKSKYGCRALKHLAASVG